MLLWGDNSGDAYWSVILPCRKRKGRGWLFRHKSWAAMGHRKGPNRKRVTWLTGRIFWCEYPTLFLHWFFFLVPAFFYREDKKKWRVKRSVGYNRSSTRSSTQHKRAERVLEIADREATTNLWHLVSHQLSYPSDELASTAFSLNWYLKIHGWWNKLKVFHPISKRQ